jgi:hypothetical protein
MALNNVGVFLLERHALDAFHDVLWFWSELSQRSLQGNLHSLPGIEAILEKPYTIYLRHGDQSR